MPFICSSQHSPRLSLLRFLFTVIFRDGSLHHSLPHRLYDSLPRQPFNSLNPHCWFNYGVIIYVAVGSGSPDQSYETYIASNLKAKERKEWNGRKPFNSTYSGLVRYPSHSCVVARAYVLGSNQRPSCVMAATGYSLYSYAPRGSPGNCCTPLPRSCADLDLAVLGTSLGISLGISLSALGRICRQSPPERKNRLPAIYTGI